MSSRLDRLGKRGKRAARMKRGRPEPANASGTPSTDYHGCGAVDFYGVEGWFINLLPDLDQDDSDASGYLIQNSLWWLGVTGLDALRQDTLLPLHPRRLVAGSTGRAAIAGATGILLAGICEAIHHNPLSFRTKISSAGLRLITGFTMGQCHG